MIFISKVHGEIKYEERNKVTFKKGILGFSHLKNFILVDLEDLEPFKLLQSLEDEEVALIVTSPFEFYKNYEVELSEELTNKLEIENEKDIMVVTTVTLNSNPKKITTNLKAPIIINISNKLGKQIILEKLDYKIKHPLIKE